MLGSRVLVVAQPQGDAEPPAARFLLKLMFAVLEFGELFPFSACSLCWSPLTQLLFPSCRFPSDLFLLNQFSPEFCFLVHSLSVCFTEDGSPELVSLLVFELLSL